MTEMEIVDRVARAIYSEPWRQGWDEIAEGARDYWRKYARAAIGAMRDREGWQLIEGAPKDGTRFLAAQDGEIYDARYTQDSPPRLTFRTHALRVEAAYEIVNISHNGESVEAQIPIRKPWAETFEHRSALWTKGFEFAPTHWMPLPSPPNVE